MNSKDFYKGKVNVKRTVEGEDGEMVEKDEKISGFELKELLRKTIIKKGYPLSGSKVEEFLEKELGIKDGQYYKRKKILRNLADRFGKN